MLNTCNLVRDLHALCITIVLFAGQTRYIVKQSSQANEGMYWHICSALSIVELGTWDCPYAVPLLWVCSRKRRNHTDGRKSSDYLLDCACSFHESTSDARWLYVVRVQWSGLGLYDSHSSFRFTLDESMKWQGPLIVHVCSAYFKTKKNSKQNKDDKQYQPYSRKKCQDSMT